MPPAVKRARWLPAWEAFGAMAALYEARFDSTDDEALDAQTTRLEDEPQTLDVIAEACHRYRVRAVLIKAGEHFGTVIPANERRVPPGA